MTTTLDKNVSRFLRHFGINKARRNERTSFCYDPNTRNIYYSVYQRSEDASHTEWIKEKYGFDVSDYVFLFAILHEVGHHMTLDQLTEEQMQMEDFTRRFLLPQMEEEGMPVEIINEVYYNLPAEDLANRWAFEYMAKNWKRCLQFNNKCVSILQHMIKVGRV